MMGARIEVDLKFNYVYSRRTKGVCVFRRFTNADADPYKYIQQFVKQGDRMEKMSIISIFRRYIYI